MSFLSAIGAGISLAKAVIAGISGSKDDDGSGLLQGKVADTMTQVAQAIGIMESVGQALSLPGEQKLKGISNTTAQLILQAPFMRGKEIEKHALFMEGVADITSGMAKVMNSLRDNGLKELKP